MTKQVIVIRKDLNMRKGKMVAQGVHASMKVFFDLMYEATVGMYSGKFLPLPSDNEMREWVDGRFTKVCVSVDSEAELLAIHEKAKEAGLPTALIQDAGLTQFGGVPTHTTVAVGPAEATKIDAITGQLKLL